MRNELAAWRTRGANRADEVQQQFAEEFPLVQRRWYLCVIQAFSRLDEAHSHYGGQPAYSKFIDLYVNLIPKHPPS